MAMSCLKRKIVVGNLEILGQGTGENEGGHEGAGSSGYVNSVCSCVETITGIVVTVVATHLD